MKLPLTGGCNCGVPEPIGIRMGMVDEAPGIRPSVRQFVAYAAPWESIPDDGPSALSQSRHSTSSE